MHLSQLHEQLFNWWQQNGRILPWREKIGGVQDVGQDSTAFSINAITDTAVLRDATLATYFASSLKRDPYRVIVAELMLQQTQVDRVLPKYEAWMKKWPKISDLAAAELSEVLIFWQGLGYNRRARFLWLLAQEIAIKRQGIWPTTEEELRLLPGIGKYTARAVMTFGFGMQVGVVDTNVKRILERVIGGLENKESLQTEKEYFELADKILPPDKADPWNQLLMDFGSLICTAKKPKCEECPIATICQINLDAQKQGYLNYSFYLQAKLEEEKTQRKFLPAKQKTRFEDTNRFFRGRIMDELRIKSHQMSQLQKIMEEKYGLVDKERFNKLIESLAKEGMIRKEDNQLKIG